MSKLILPSESAPSNLRLRKTVKTRFVDGDLYDIARRVQEMHPSVYVVEMAEGGQAAWAVMEDCHDGVQRLMFKTDVLDGRVLDKLARIIHVPFEHRLAEAEKIEEESKAKAHETELEELYERVGRPMWTQLEHDGFIQRNRSYAKAGVSRRGRYAR